MKKAIPARHLYIAMISRQSVQVAFFSSLG